MSRFLVTGCAGFIGSHLVESLLERGDEVVGLDYFTDFYSRDLKEQNVAGARAQDAFSLVELDLADACPAPLLEGVDGIFHLAARPGVRPSWGTTFSSYLRDNVLASQRLFEGAAQARIRVVFASSSSVYGQSEAHPTPEDQPLRPLSPYGITKVACEQLARAYLTSFDADIICLRYFSVYGPRQRPDMAFNRIATDVLTARSFKLYGTGKQSRDFTYVGDVVAANLAAMEQAPPGTVYNVGGGTEATLLDAIEICERLTGRRLSVQYHAAAAGDPARTTADTTKIREELSWKPKTSLQEGLSAQVSWIEAKLSAPSWEGSAAPEVASIGPGRALSQRESA